MVLYFSGTGNSKYAAQCIADALGDTLLSINDRVRSSDTSPVEVGGRLVIVTPTYAWRIPRVVQLWLQKTELRGAEQTWFVMTCGSEIGNAAGHNRSFCIDKGLFYMGTAQIVMPENYIAMFDVPAPDEARQIVARARPDIEKSAALIAEGREFSPPRSSLTYRFMSRVVNPIFYPVFVKAAPFTVSDDCTGCAQCAERCPMNNIAIQNGRPVWGNQCTHCMACICYCRAEAIEYGKKSLGKPRYRFDAL